MIIFITLFFNIILSCYCIYSRVGFSVATHPWKVILISLTIGLLCVVGVVELEEENRGEKNWVSQTSDPIKHKEWVDEVFPIAFREEGLLLETSNEGNVLTPQALLKVNTSS